MPRTRTKTKRRGSKVTRVDAPHEDYVAAEKMLRDVPKVVLGLDRPVFLGLIGGLARLVRGAEKDEVIRGQLLRVENACLTAVVLDIVETTVRGKGPAVNAPGGSDARPS